MQRRIKLTSRISESKSLMPSRLRVREHLSACTNSYSPRISTCCGPSRKLMRTLSSASSKLASIYWSITSNISRFLTSSKCFLMYCNCAWRSTVVRSSSYRAITIPRSLNSSTTRRTWPLIWPSSLDLWSRDRDHKLPTILSETSQSRFSTRTALMRRLVSRILQFSFKNSQKRRQEQCMEISVVYWVSLTERLIC